MPKKKVKKKPQKKKVIAEPVAQIPKPKPVPKLKTFSFKISEHELKRIGILANYYHALGALKRGTSGELIRWAIRLLDEETIKRVKAKRDIQERM